MPRTDISSILDAIVTRQAKKLALLAPGERAYPLADLSFGRLPTDRQGAGS